MHIHIIHVLMGICQVQLLLKEMGRLNQIKELNNWFTLLRQKQATALPRHRPMTL